jgi:hypothetical protein
MTIGVAGKPTVLTAVGTQIFLTSTFLPLILIRLYPRADGAKRRARVLIPPGYLHPGKRKH